MGRYNEFDVIRGRLVGSSDNRPYGFRNDPSLDWQRQGACRSVQPDRFFPEGRPANEPRQVCASCPVREECLQFALDHNEEGIWGGLTEPQRRRLQQNRAASIGGPK